METITQDARHLRTVVGRRSPSTRSSRGPTPEKLALKVCAPGDSVPIFEGRDSVSHRLGPQERGAVVEGDGAHDRWIAGRGHDDVGGEDRSLGRGRDVSVVLVVAGTTSTETGVSEVAPE